MLAGRSEEAGRAVLLAKNVGRKMGYEGQTGIGFGTGDRKSGGFEIFRVIRVFSWLVALRGCFGWRGTRAPISIVVKR